MTERVTLAGLAIAKPLYDLVRDEICPGSGIDADHVWRAFADILRDLTPKNRALLERRDALQAQIDDWHRAHKGEAFDLQGYKQFLTDIGYLVPEGGDFHITTRHVDPEIAKVSGPQLVVPVNNARYALNACNSRWGNLFDALYGTDAIPEDDGAERGKSFNPKRFVKVLAYSYDMLDQAVPLTNGSHAEVKCYRVEDGAVVAELATGDSAGLAHMEQFVGYCADQDDEHLLSLLLCNHGLHVELEFDRSYYLGQLNPAGIKYIWMEAAITTIQDCEDSVAAVDGDDKVQVYRNWLGLMKGDLSVKVAKGGETITRALAPDRHYTAAQGGELILPGRSLMLVRNVGHLMTTDAVLTADGAEIPEGMLDAMITVLCALHDLRDTGRYSNSRTGSVYVVKPKMHGPEEVAFCVELFERVEDALALARNIIKIGIMDEERRTTVNLRECIRAAQERVIFINTGFLDRTGDEIHTCMEAGPVLRKGDMKRAAWLQAYENWNVDVGLSCGLKGKAQIGKGMWTMPNEMRAMLETKIAHPQAGASCAWVPSPAAATLHALHYHAVDVARRQCELAYRSHASLDEILQIPVVSNPSWSEQEIHEELENNIHAILGYVVRWVEQGVGCSTVPDIFHVGLMEDRATLRISSQHVANWLHHGIVTQTQVDEVLHDMARVVDEQNAGDPNYTGMAPDCNGPAYSAARELILRAREIPNGYTEPTLHHWRRQAKSIAAK